MGEVYKAFDPSLERTVALKTILPDAENPMFLERLYREAKACGRLRHPGIVTVHDLGEVDGVVFIAMEYLEGRSLAAAINDGRLSFEHKIEILIQMLAALHYAHLQGVIHRDIKPSNALLLTDGSVKLLDFGLARVTRAESLTQSGSVMGTPHYMSPEQMKGQHVDARTDVYSTGIVAYELLTRRRAFDGDRITTVMLKVLSEPPPPMDTAWSRAFPEIERIVNRAIAKSANDRYETADEMKHALEAFIQSAKAEIDRTAAEVTLVSKRAVAEANTLVSQGRIDDVKTLLGKTIKADPDSVEARALLAELTEAPEPEPPGPPAPPRVGEPRPPVAFATPPTPPSAPVVQVPFQPARSSRRAMVWSFAAVVVVAGGVSVGLCSRTRQPQVAPPSASASSTSPDPSARQTPPVQTADSPPAPSSQQPALSRPDPVAQPSTQPEGQPSSSGRQAAPARVRTATASSVYIDAAATNRDLGIALMTALRARGLGVASSSSAARWSATPDGTITVRKSAFDSGLTADYVGTLTIRGASAGGRQTLQFDGHALEFGEANARAAAVRALADRMADAIEKAAADTPQKE